MSVANAAARGPRPGPLLARGAGPALSQERSGAPVPATDALLPGYNCINAARTNLVFALAIG
jgi:hypothetical protein